MVDVINLSANYEKQLFDMIRNHIRQIPPFFVPTDDEICSIINEPNFTSEKWYGNFEYFHEVIVGVKQGVN
ncbi:hypothetical protein [Paenibacillus sp. RC67]|uniref:hypothetical protein n=1 Tax=Paenibacillus sp. RC67 TaxID=3039392 RepID=UPI0024AD3AB3|nr:hypothetical protein [Paenibacillus sp. RC67]